MKALVPLFTTYSTCWSVLGLLILNVLLVIYKHFSFLVLFLRYNLITDAVQLLMLQRLFFFCKVEPLCSLLQGILLLEAANTVEMMEKNRNLICIFIRWGRPDMDLMGNGYCLVICRSKLASFSCPCRLCSSLHHFPGKGAGLCARALSPGWELLLSGPASLHPLGVP